MKIHNVKMVKRLKRGHFSKVYLGEDGLVYHLVSDNHCDYSKEAIALFGNCEHSPRIERLDDVYIPRSGWHYAFRMPKYFPVQGENRKVVKKLKDSWESYYSMNWRIEKTGYEMVMKWFENELEKLNVPEPIKESICCIYDSVLNYGESFLLEFPYWNVKQDNNGKIIFLDIVFDTKKVR